MFCDNSLGIFGRRNLREGLPHGHQPLLPREIPLTRHQSVSSFAHRVIPNDMWPIVPCLAVADESSKKERYSGRDATNMTSGRRTGQNDSQGTQQGIAALSSSAPHAVDRQGRSPLLTAEHSANPSDFNRDLGAYQRMSINCHERASLLEQ